MVVMVFLWARGGGCMASFLEKKKRKKRMSLHRVASLVACPVASLHLPQILIIHVIHSSSHRRYIGRRIVVTSSIHRRYIDVTSRRYIPTLHHASSARGTEPDEP